MPFSLELGVSIGPKGMPGEEIFYVNVMNSSFLAEEVRRSGAQLITGAIVLDTFSLTAIETIVAEYCAGCRGETWRDVVWLLSRLGKWEYEGMTSL